MSSIGTKTGELQKQSRWLPGIVFVVMVALLMAVQFSPTNVAEAKLEKSRLVSGWFGSWSSAGEMIRVAKDSDGVLGEVNIFWWNYQGPSNPICTYDAASCGASSSTPWTNRKYAAAVKGLQAEGIEVYASHTDLWSGRARSLSSYLATKKNRRALADQMTDWAVKSGVDGVDLDWENFAFSDGMSSWVVTKPRFVKTIRGLSKRLHAVGKKLSVTVPGGYQPFKDGKPNPGGGYWVYAWSEIAPMVDRLRLMTYDYSWNRPGPIGPHAWADRVTASAVAQVGPTNRKKVYVGVHQYGKAWHVRDSRDNHVTSGECHASWKPSGGNGIALSPDDAADVAAYYGQEPRFHSGHKEWTFRYLKSESGSIVNKDGQTQTQTCDVWKEVWYGDTSTAVGRADLVKKHGIGGIAVWQLASTRSDFYPRLRPYVARELSATASTLRPRAGSSVTVRGQLSRAGEGIKIKRQWKTRGKWRTQESARTDSLGRVSFKIKLRNKPRTYKFRLKRPRVKSSVLRIVANPAPQIVFTRSTSAAGAKVVFRAKVSPPVKGQRVGRQLKRDGRWQTLQTKSTNRLGIVRFRTEFYDEPRRYKYRVYVHPSAKTSAGHSSVMRFKTQ